MRVDKKSWKINGSEKDDTAHQTVKNRAFSERESDRDNESDHRSHCCRQHARRRTGRRRPGRENLGRRALTADVGAMNGAAIPLGRVLACVRRSMCGGGLQQST